MYLYMYKVGPGKPVISIGWNNSAYRGYNPSYPSIRPFLGVIISCITSRGPSSNTNIYIYIHPGVDYAYAHEICSKGH